jgi:hypothetical protein
LEPVLGERVLPAQVDITALAPGGVGRDRHRLDHRERVALHDHPVLERPRLRFVGVADQVVRSARLARHRLPLAAGGERRAAAPHQLGVGHLAEHALRADLQRASERGVAAVGAVVLKAGGIDHTDPSQEAKPGPAGLRWLRRRRGRRRGAAHNLEQTVGVDAGQLSLGGGGA